jgi:hypothetical protein
MANALHELARNPKFIPLVYDYCDMWCERCPITDSCLLFAVAQQRPPGTAGLGGERGGVEAAMAFTRAVIEESRPEDKPIARLDLSMCDASIAPKEPAFGHPLEYLARHYAVQSAGFLRPLRSGTDGALPRGSALEILDSYHLLIAVKTYRSLISDYRSGAEPELRRDALGCAKLVLIAIDRSRAAWHSLAVADDDARIGGMLELLEALATAIEMRFPEARAFVRPGLDEAAFIAASAGDALLDVRRS